MAEIINYKFLLQSCMMTMAVKVGLVVEAAMMVLALVVFLKVMELMVVEVKETVNSSGKKGQ